MSSNIVCWFNLPAQDLERAKNFYTKLLNWKFQPFTADGKEVILWMVLEGDKPVGGIKLAPQDTASEIGLGAITYFTSADGIQQVTEKAKSLGSTITQEKVAIPGDGGYFIHITDSENNTVGIWSQSE
ncbi:MAG: VOC family protein [Chlamydiales bacterium]|nr:VOC family protein [Chlamydiales bacterium]